MLLHLIKYKATCRLRKGNKYIFIQLCVPMYQECLRTGNNFVKIEYVDSLREI